MSGTVKLMALPVALSCNNLLPRINLWLCRISCAGCCTGYAMLSTIVYRANGLQYWLTWHAQNSPGRLPTAGMTVERQPNKFSFRQRRVFG
ncbi:hypothetical protein CEXT_497651 [Caerostris extrusa]|uniref:Secreted protein n=1 Tax=Caerostris extrusa TaxID=172846 RepID=A0AAV4XUR7_CAEEX|nr:hypothetical protein CEXT_497651 [Caerostris extrusa]